jgi:ubiquinone/menaquinone biosynthesis C-methylase UbiE
MNKDFAKFEHEFWEGAADAYDSGFGNITAKTAQYLLDEVQLRSGQKLLDLACGPGYIAAAALQFGAEVTGVDFSLHMIALAAKKYSRAILRVGDAQNLEFEDNTFDAITCNFGIMHLPEPQKCFSESLRVLKPGGRFAFVVWNAPDKPGALNIIMNAIKEHGTLEIKLPEGPPFFQYAHHDNATKAVKDAGFTDVRAQDVGIHWTIKNADDMIGAFYNGGARIGGILRAQNPEALAKIRAEVAQKIESHRANGGFEVPVSVVMTSGQKKL